jgi:CBS domain-containing protein
MRVREVMRRSVETVPEAASAETALRLMRTRRLRHLVATKGGEVVGVVSDRDLQALGALRSARSVGDAMTAPAVTAKPGMTLRQAANLLRGRTIGCLPVLERGKLVGIVTTTDLLELIGRGAERPVAKGKRWILKGRGPRRKSVAGRRDVAVG